MFVHTNILVRDIRLNISGALNPKQNTEHKLENLINEQNTCLTENSVPEAELWCSVHFSIQRG